MEIVILSASLIMACLAGLLVNTALVKTYDPRGAESSARARTRAEEAKEREGSRKTWLTSVGEMASSVMPMAKSQENAIALRLARAGIKTTVAMYWAAVLLSAATGIVMGAGLALIIDGTVLAKFAIAALFLLIGFVAPRFYVAVKTRRRAEEIEASLPPTLELLSVVVEAGQTVERGIKEIATRTQGPLAEEFAIVNADITRYHKKTSDALADMNRRCNLKSVGLFCTSVSQALEQGSAIGRILKTQAEIASENYYMSVEEQSNKIGVKMSVAIIFFLLPPVLIISIGPALINLLNNANGVLGL